MSAGTKTTLRQLPKIALLTAVLAAGCSDPGDPPGQTQGSDEQVPVRREDVEAAAAAPKPAAASPEELARQGRQLYLSSCIACHNADPAKDGALGPAVAGSSPELVEARVLRGEYPEGYVPKRDTAAMVAMPFLEKQIPAIAAYLVTSPAGN